MNIPPAWNVTPPVSEQGAAKRKEVQRLRCYTALALGDAAALAMAFLTANHVYLSDIDSPQGLTILGAVLPIYLILAAYNKAYSGITLEKAKIGIVYAAQALIWAVATILFVAYFLKAGSHFSRVVFTIGSMGGLALICAVRLTLGRMIKSLLGGTPFKTLVVQDGVDYIPSGLEKVLTLNEIGFDPETQDPYLYHLFATSVASADRLIIACPQTRYRSWSTVLKSMSIDGEILTHEEDDLGIIGIGRQGDRQTLIVSVQPLHLRQRIFKRIFDIAFASFSLLFLSPLLIVIAIAIRLETPGPVFFRQDRIGRDNRIFRMYKFRSMHDEESDQNASQLTRRDDSRVTRVGKFIRARSLDELPQLLNVLNGTMSVVGPRPHAISAKAGNLLYWHVDDRYRFRHSMKPGLTGLAQVRGFRGATDREEDLTNRLSADLEYLSQWSISRDAWIILQTLVVLRHDNAF